MVVCRFFHRCANGKYPYSGRTTRRRFEGNVPKDCKVRWKIVTKYRKHFKEFNATLDNVIDETWFIADIEECMTNVSKF